MTSQSPEPDPRLLVACERVCDLRNPDPKLGLMRGDYCTEKDCNAEVWIDPKLSHLLSKEARATLMGVGTRVVCSVCVTKYRVGTAVVVRRYAEKITKAKRQNELN